MDGGRRGQRKRSSRSQENQSGYMDQFASWTGKKFGRAAKAGMGELEVGKLLSNELVKASLDEFKSQLPVIMRMAVRSGGREFNERLGEILETFSEKVKKLSDEVLAKSGKRIIAYSTLGVMSSICVWYGAKAFEGHISHLLRKPKVIIRSSRVSFFQKLKWFVFGKPKKSPVKMIFPPQLRDRLSQIIEVTRGTKKHIQDKKQGVKYRNLLLYGPPGTGKTMFARKLTEEAGLEEFVEVTGSSFFQKGAGIRAIDELFDWANRSKGGLCIFIDEADSAVMERKNVQQHSENYRITNHLLNRTGQRSDKFMVAMATNHPTNFGGAMRRRIDDAIELPLPGKAERYIALQHYRQTILLHEDNEHAFIKSVNQHLTDKKLQEIAHEIEEFSYGDIAGIMNKIRTNAFTTKNCLLNTTLISDVVREYKQRNETLSPKSPKKDEK